MEDGRKHRRARWSHLPFPALAAIVFLGSADVMAQGTGCVLQPTSFPARQVIRCGTGLTVEATAGADYTLVDHNKDTVPDAVTLRAGAVLVHAPAQAGGRAFRVQTPQAIAAVRGTDWAVDAASGKTSVFVVTGRVAVQRTGGARGVTLGPGEGVDVEASNAPLQVKRWPAERAAALLARFGR
jgi:ferric-dicitrate binding protein FerR (iron transport regulator)